MDIICPHCKTANPPHKVMCGHCRTVLPAPVGPAPAAPQPRAPPGQKIALPVPVPAPVPRTPPAAVTPPPPVPPGMITTPPSAPVLAPLHSAVTQPLPATAPIPPAAPGPLAVVPPPPAPAAAPLFAPTASVVIPGGAPIVVSPGATLVVNIPSRPSGGPIQWETNDLVYPFPADTRPLRLGTPGHTQEGACREFWLRARLAIEAAMQPWRNEGWEPQRPPESSQIELRTYYGHADKPGHYWLLLALFSLPSFGLLFLIALLRLSLLARPLRMTVPMRRPLDPTGPRGPAPPAAPPLPPSPPLLTGRRILWLTLCGLYLLSMVILLVWLVLITRGSA